MPIQRTHLSALGVAALLACALPALAQSLPGFGPGHPAVDGFGKPQVENRYRIGIDCAPAPEALKVHLHLNEESGLLVNSVLDDSPSGRAGLKRHDVLLEANSHPLSTVRDLIEAVNDAKDQEMTLTVIHAGEQKTLKLTPEERDEKEIERLRNGFGNRIGQNPLLPGFEIPLNGGNVDMNQIQAQMQNAIEQMQQQLGNGANGWRRFGPGIMMGFEDLQNAAPFQGQSWSRSKSTSTRSFDLPGGEEVTVTVDREGDEPAKIHVERGNESWDLTEADLGQLPADLKPLVQSQLNGGGRLIEGLMPPRRPRANAKPVAPKQPGIEDRFEGLELKMQELKDAIRSIQGDN